MAVRQHPTSLLLALPTDMAIDITGYLTATLKRPMDDLRSLQVTCLFMRCICGNRAVGRRVAMDRCRRGARSWNNLNNYYALFSSLT
jgi:hypothetical protein